MSGQEENIYEPNNPYDYVNHKEIANFRSAPTAPSQADVTKKKSCKKLWRGIIIGLGVTIIALLCAIIGLITTQVIGKDLQNVGEASNKLTRSKSEARSCAELRKDGTKTSGIYRIQPVENELSFETYCDMETDGGGWSLIASIHDSDIRRKCYSDDVWSSYVPGNQIELIGETNWDNEMTFGSVHKCTQKDYKNAAFYALNASNIMLWHVQSIHGIDKMRDRTTLRYRTSNNFLQRYGGNLKNLFGEHFPLTVKPENKHREITEALMTKGDAIKSKISNWYEYTVESGYYIKDPKMYASYGNQIHFLDSRSSTYISNGKEYSFIRFHTTVKSITTTPYTLISVIRNDDRISKHFDIQASSRRSPDGENITTFENTTTLGNYKLQYHAVHFLDPNFQTVCRLFFVISNTEDWKSVEPSRFYCSWCSYSSLLRSTRYRIDNYPARVIFGYMLLAKKAGHNMTSEELKNVAEAILNSIAEAPNVFRSASTNSTLVAPITFDKGDTRTVLSSIPTNFQAEVEPGFLQFRAYNYTGYPNAICPAVKVDTISPEYVCIGGISGDIGPHGTCGDFAGWAGKAPEGTLVNLASGSAHSDVEIASTIMLFYR